MKNGRKTKTTIFAPFPLPIPWDGFSYFDILTGIRGELVSDGRSSRVYQFIYSGECYFLKRYQYRKIHWHFCWRKSQVRLEFENLEKIRRSKLPCKVIDVLAYGEQRYFCTLVDAFLLSRKVPGGERLSFFLNHLDHPRRQSVLNVLLDLVEGLIRQKMALTDFFFRNIVVVAEKAELFLLDVQRFDHSVRRAHGKSYPQFWSNMILFCTTDELRQAKKRLTLLLSEGTFAKIEERAQSFIHREKERQQDEREFAKYLSAGDELHR
jgi:hypothetical protein